MSETRWRCWFDELAVLLLERLVGREAGVFLVDAQVGGPAIVEVGVVAVGFSSYSTMASG